jgi:hydrogenase/urease accessory protein HupE
VIVEVSLRDGSSSRALLHEGQERFMIPEGQGRASVIGAYLRLGVEHLLTGVDHVLFVLGLLILIRGWRRLAAAITSFTVGHSVSLCLSVLGIIRVPVAPIEVAIAATIMILALDILRRHREESAGPVAKQPWMLCALFGLLHGLGFAGALAHAGLPDQAIPLALFAFNVGIEVGQLLIVAAFALVSLLFLRSDSPRTSWFRAVPAYILGSLAAFWILERGLGAFTALPY